MSQIQTSVLTRPTMDRIIASISDSSGGDIGTGVDEFLAWPSVLVNRLNDPALGLANVRERRNSYSGRTTQNTALNGQVTYKMCLRPWVYETPVLAIISMGVNDPGAGVTTNQTTANLEAMIMGLLFGCAANGANSAVVADQTALPAGNNGGWGHDTQGVPDRCVVLADGAANGGITPYWSPAGALATVGGAGNGGINVWECVYSNVAGVAGWRRVANLSTFNTLVTATPTLNIPGGIPYVLLNGAWYQNFSNGTGDVTKACTGITRSGTTATATVTQAWANGNTVNIPNASDPNLCGSYVISGVTATTFNYTVANTGATSVGACNATLMTASYDDVAGVRLAQKNAVAAIAGTDRIKYCDQWAAEQAQITSGNTTQGSEVFNLAANNQHRNVAGHDFMAYNLYNTIANWSSLMKLLQYPT